MSEFDYKLYRACRRGNKDLALSILIAKRHRVSHDWNSTVLHEACRHGWLDIVKLLIEKHDSYSLNMREKLRRQSPLHYCCRYGRVDIVIYLIERGCNPFLRDIKKKEPLDYALENNYTFIVSYICQHCVSSAMVLANDRLETTLNVLKNMHQDNSHHLDWKTSDGYNILETVYHSKLMATNMLSKDIMKLLNKIHARIQLIAVDNIPHLICHDQSSVSCVPSGVMLEWLTDTSLHPMKLVISCNWKTADGDTLLRLLFQSKSCVSLISSTVMLKWLTDTTDDLMKLIVPNYKTADGDTLLQLVCQSQSCVSRISSTVILKWLTDTSLDLTELIVPNYKTADGDTLLQLVCQTPTCVSHISSTVMLKWLNDTTICCKHIRPNLETADGDTLLQLICQSESCISCISSVTMVSWLKDTNVDTLIAGLDWKTADGETMIELTHPPELQAEPLGIDNAIGVVITPHWETAEGGTSLQVVYWSELYISSLSSRSLSNFLHKTAIDLEKIAIPHWKTADGDTLLQLLCQSESCVSRISSTVMLKYLTDTTVDLMKLLVPKYETASGDTLLQLVCQSQSCVSRISSTVMLKLLTDPSIDLSIELIVPNYKTADGDTLLQLVCQSELCISQISSITMGNWLKNTNVDILIPGLNWMTADGISMIKITIRLHTEPLTIDDPFNVTVVITPHWETVEGITSLQVVYWSESYILSVSSTSLSNFLQKTTVNLEKIVLIPYWKTADGDTLLQLLCQSKSCVSCISSTVMLKWLNYTTVDYNHIMLNLETSDGVTLLQLVCRTPTCVSHISSTVMLKWLTETTIPYKHIIPNLETADGDTLLQLICQSASCISCISSITMVTWLKYTNVDTLIVGLDWKTADGKTMIEVTHPPELQAESLGIDNAIGVVITPLWETVESLQVVYLSELYISCVSSRSLSNFFHKTTLDLEKIAIPHWKTADGNALLQLLCQSESCVSRISSTVMLKWLTDTTVDLMELILPNYKTADGDTLLQLVCQTQICVSRISSIIMLKWLTDTISDYNSSIMPNYKTADGDTLLQLVCQSESCMSRISSVTMENWLKNTDVDLVIAGLYWKTADGIDMIDITHQLQAQPLGIDNAIDVIITPHWETVEGGTSLQVVYRSELYVSCVSSNSLSNFLRKTTVDLEKIVIPHWKTADGDTLLQLVCKSESCVSRISSSIMLQWLIETTVDNKLIMPNFKTADKDTLLQLVCQTQTCVLRISSTVMLKWLTDNQLDLEFLAPNYNTADGDTLLQLVCQSKSCVSCISSITMKNWLKNTDVDVLIAGHDWITADGVSMINIAHLLQSKRTFLRRSDTPVHLIITPHLETVDDSISMQVLYHSKWFISNLSSSQLLKWLEKTTLDLEKFIIPHWKTADGDTLLQLVCQSKSCVSRISSITMETWLKNTKVDLVIAGLDWKTADGINMINITNQLQTELLTIDNAIDVVITPHWETVEGVTCLQVVYRSELYISCVSTRSLSNFLRKTTIDLEKIIIPHWKTADGDTLLQLVCISDSCVSRISSTIMLKWLTDIPLDIKELIIPNYKTADGDSLLQIVCRSKSCVSCIFSVTMETWLLNTDVDLVIAGIDWKTADGKTMIEVTHQLQAEPLGIDNAIDVVITPHWETVEGGTSLQVVYRSELYISCLSTRSLSNFLQKTTVDLENIVIPHWKTADGDTLLQLVCKSESCVSRISSTIMLKWLTDTTVDYKHILPNLETADGDNLLQLVCQSKSCVSRISSVTMETWLKNTKVDLVIAGIDWKTADGKTMIEVTHQLQAEPLGIDNAIDVIITPHWETVEGGTSLQVVYRSELYVSCVSSNSLSNFLRKTTVDLKKIVVPHWKTADGDTLLQLVCKSKSCVSRISSTKMIKWLTYTTVDYKHIMLKYKTADGDTLLQLVCQSQSCVSRISSTVMLKLLTGTTLDLMKLIVPNYKTVDGNTLLQLVCQSESCVSRISSVTMEIWLKNTSFDLVIAGLDWKTADGVTMARIILQLELSQPFVQLGSLSADITNETDIIITRHWPGNGNETLLVLFLSELYISRLRSTSLFKWLQLTTLGNIERIVVPNYMTADGDTLLQLVCQSKHCVSRISSEVMLKWLTDTPLDLMELIIPNYKTADGDTLLQLVCQSDSYVSRISSTIMLKWLIGIPIDLSTVSANYKTANGDTLLQLVCQSESCVSCISSAMIERWLRSTTVDLTIFGLDWKTTDGVSMIKILRKLEPRHALTEIDSSVIPIESDAVITPYWTIPGKITMQVLYKSELYIAQLCSKSLVKWLEKTTLDLERIVVPNWETADGDTLLQLVCQSESCVSHISSTMVESWLRGTTVDIFISGLDWQTTDGVSMIRILRTLECRHTLTEIDSSAIPIESDVVITPHWTFSGKTTIQVLYKSELYIAQLCSKNIVKWLEKTTLDLERIVVPNWKTADGDTLLQLVCKSESCVSSISSTTIESWLRSTTVDIFISGLDWQTTDGVSMIRILRKLEPTHILIGILSSAIPIDAVITPHWTIPGKTTIQVLYKSELYIAQICSKSLVKWLEKTTLDLEVIVVPNWKTADGDTLLQLVCQSESCVSRISSTKMLKWLTDTPIDLKSKTVNLNTADDESILQLVCQSESCLSHITSTVVLEWLNNKPPDLAELYIIPNYKTADGDPLLQLVCQSKSCVSCISSTTMETWLKDTKVDLLIAGLDWKTIDGVTMIKIIRQLQTPQLKTFARGTPIDVIITPHWESVDSSISFQVLFRSEWFVSHLSSSKLLKWLEKTPIDLEKIIIPHWKTADGDTLIELVCQSESLLSQISSEAILNGMNTLEFTLVGSILPSWKTADGHTIFKLFCTSQCSLSHISSELMLHGLNDCDEATFDVLKSFKPDSTTADGDLFLHLLCQSNVEDNKVIQLLHYYLQEGHLNLNIRDSDGDTAFQLACKVDKTAVVKYLLKQGNCNPNDKNLRNESPIELTTNIDIISMLIEHGATFTPELVLKLAAIESIPKDLLAKLIWNPDNCNSEGNTALHLSCQEDQPDTVKLLLSQAHCNPNIKNNKEEVPLQMTTNSEIIKDLIRYGAQTSIMYESHKSALGTNEPIKPPVKIFVVGNPFVGKSTLTAALKKKLKLVSRLFTSGKVSGVDKKTVGIVPHKFESEIFGRVTVYDFAGHREFYSGHAALLQASVQSTPPIFLLVVNLCDGEDDIIQNILYWISFLENQCTLVSCKPHVIIVGSHADTLRSNKVNPQGKVDNIVHLLDPNYFINLKFITFIPMDCQLHESAGMNDLRPLLVKSCGELRIQQPITFNAHCFLVYLLDTFKQTPAVTISTIHEQVERQQLSHTKGEVLDFLPKSIGALYKICLELNERGHILFLKDKTNLENSYVVIDEKSLLYEVSGTVFASEIFNQYKEVASNTGVVALSKIAECFPGKDLNILIGFLTHLEFCHEISDQALFQLISEKYSPDFDERYYLFSGLISAKAQDSIWEAKSNFKYSFGWILRCMEIQQFFSSRFLEVLLLRLVFSFASTEDPKKLAIHRKCTLWKNGIFWGTHFGMDTLVEIIDNKSVIVMSRFRASNLVKCVEYRSRVLHTVLKCVQEFCPRILTVESFIDTSSNSALEYPFVLTSKRTLCTVKDLAEALVSNSEYPSVVLSGSGKSIPAEMFFSFEPYAEIEAFILQELLDKNNETKVVPDIFLSRLFEKVSKNVELMIKIFNESACIPCSKDALLQEILNWRDRSRTEPMTYSDLRKKLDEHSIFAGRNVLNLAGRKVLSSSKVQGESVGSSLRSIPPLIVQGNAPKLHELLLLKFANGKELRIMEAVAPIWQKVAVTFGFDQPRIQSIEMGAHYQPEDASREMFCIWLEGAHDLKPATWSTLSQSLKDVKLTEIADVLSHLKINEDKTSNQPSTESLAEPSSTSKSLDDDMKAKSVSRLRYESLQELPTGQLSEEIHKSQQQNETESWLTLEWHRGFAGEDESDHAESRLKASPSLEVSVMDISTVTLFPKLFVQGNAPDLRELLVLEFPDGKEVRIREAVAPIWKNIAITLGFNRAKIKSIEMGCHYKPEDACLEMFRVWLKGAHDLKPATWSTLIQSLKDVKLTEIADMLSNLEVKDDGISNQSSTESVPVPSSAFDEDFIAETECITRHESLQENPIEESSKENNKQYSFQVQGSLPKLDMKALELTEGRGGRNIKVIEDIGSHWEDLAVVLGIQEEFIDQIKSKHPSLSHHKACHEILTIWLESNDGEVSWRTLTQGLITAGLPELADNLRETLRLD